MMLPTRRAVVILAALAPLALLGYAWGGAVDLLLAADALLVIALYIDARVAPDPAALELRREAPASFSMGRAAPVRYRWRNPGYRIARLLIREEWPAILGGVRPERALVLPPHAATDEVLSVEAARRGRETRGSIAVRSVGPLGLGQRQRRLDLPWDVTVFPALPASRLRAAIAQATRRHAGAHALRRRGEGRAFESLREWGHENAMNAKEMLAENNAMTATLEADDKLAALAKENKMVRERIRLLDERNNGMMGEVGAMAQATKMWQGKFLRLEKTVKRNGAAA